MIKKLRQRTAKQLRLARRQQFVVNLYGRHEFFKIRHTRSSTLGPQQPRANFGHLMQPSGSSGTRSGLSRPT